jgi:dihydropteridine reductase
MRISVIIPMPNSMMMMMHLQRRIGTTLVRRQRAGRIGFVQRSLHKNNNSTLSKIEDEEDDEGAQHGRPTKALVLGSSGALGSHVARHLSMELKMQVLGADVMEIPHELTGDWELDGFCALQKDASLSELTRALVHGVHSFVAQDGKGLDVIICASGGWKPDPEPPKTPNVAKNYHNNYKNGLGEDAILQHATAYTETVSSMMHMNLDPVIASSFLAHHYMNTKTGGLMVVIGATAALSPAPGMLGYALAKSASHYLVQTLGACTEHSLESKSIRKMGRSVRQHLPSLDRLRVTGILPTTLDTPANRMARGTTDVRQWVKPQDISKTIAEWITKPSLRPHSGSLFKIFPTEDGKAGLELVR